MAGDGGAWRPQWRPGGVADDGGGGAQAWALPPIPHPPAAPTPPARPPPPPRPSRTARACASLLASQARATLDPVLAPLLDVHPRAAVPGPGAEWVGGRGGVPAPVLPTPRPPPLLPFLSHPAAEDAPSWLEAVLWPETCGLGGAEGEGAGVEGPSARPPLSALALTPLPDPALLVGYAGDWLEVAPEVLRLWERAPLEPASARKAVRTLLLAPAGTAAADARDLVADVAGVWRDCGLGEHAAAGRAGGCVVEYCVAGDVDRDGDCGDAAADAHLAPDLESLGAAYADMQRSLALALPPPRWPGPGPDGACDGSLVVYVVPPRRGPRAALAALLACVRAVAGAGAGERGASPGWGDRASSTAGGSGGGGGVATRSAAARLASGGGGGAAARYSGATPEAYGGSGEGVGRALGDVPTPAPACKPLAVPATLQALPPGPGDAGGAVARALAFCVYSKLAPTPAAGATRPGGAAAAHEALACIAPADDSAGLHAAYASGPAAAALAMAWTDGRGELLEVKALPLPSGGAADGAAVVRAVLGATRAVLHRARRASLRNAPLADLHVCRLGQAPAGEAVAWREALGPFCEAESVAGAAVVALAADPPARLARAADTRSGLFMVTESGADRAASGGLGGDGLACEACAAVVWAPPGAPAAEAAHPTPRLLALEDDVARTLVTRAVAASGRGGLSATARELHALGRLNLACEAAALGGRGWASPLAHLPQHAGAALRLARLLEASE